MWRVDTGAGHRIPIVETVYLFDNVSEDDINRVKASAGAAKTANLIVGC